MSKIYLGDSVYAVCDGYSVTLTTENGFGPSNTIVLEVGVLVQLPRYAAEVLPHTAKAMARVVDEVQK